MDVSRNPSNPFVHSLQLSYLQIVKMTFLGLTVLPVRLLVALCCMVLSTTLAYIGLYKLENKDIDRRPFTGWRLLLRKVICYILRFMFFVCGFHRVKIIGEQASPCDARILAVAPHSTFFDALGVIVMGAPSVVAKAETSSVPFWGCLIRYTQPVLVHRNDPNSRQNTIKQIVERSTPADDWQQVLIFPEGTCTNRSSFITFRPGAFLPGVPVQPVLLRYNNTLDTVTWTWEGLPAWKVICYTLSQFNVNYSIQFLDPYVPNQAEIDDAKIFANNVRSVMAKSLGISSTDCSYFDYLRIEKSQRRGKYLQKFQNRLETPLIDATGYIDVLNEKQAQCQAEKEKFMEKIGAGKDLPGSIEICEDFLTEKSDLRDLRLSVLISGSQNSLKCFLEVAFKMFDNHLGQENISRETCLHLLKVHLFLSDKEANEALEVISGLDTVNSQSFEFFITQKKPNYLKVLRATENQLYTGMTDLLSKTAGITAERMAASLEKVAASGSSLVSDMTATVAAGREKMSDVLSSAVTSLHKKTDSISEKKKE